MGLIHPMFCCLVTGLSRLQSLTPSWKILEIAQQQSISLNQSSIFELRLLNLKFERCQKTFKICHWSDTFRFRILA